MPDRAALTPGYERILPPESMREYGTQFVRSLALEAFVRLEFLHPRGLFYDMEHAHLATTSVGVVWASSRHVKQGQEKVGTMELLPDFDAEPRTWSDARRRDWLLGMYGGPWPRFQMTLSGVWAWRYDDRQFLSTVDHELCHAGVARDRHGAPRFNEKTEEPVWAIRAHDVEQFVGPVRRWGAAAAGVADIVDAANQRPRFDWVPGSDFAPAQCATCRTKGR